jgi:hypothetical protein
MQKTLYYDFRYGIKDYDFEIDVDADDIIEYLKPEGYQNWSDDKKLAYKKAIDDLLWNDMLDDFIDNDRDFTEWLEEKYYNQAYEEYESLKEGDNY